MTKKTKDLFTIQEEKLNKLLTKITELKIKEEDIGWLNVKIFLYSVGRINQLQAMLYLSKVGLENGMTYEQITSLINDD